jgi:hypothetical protein
LAVERTGREVDFALSPRRRRTAAALRDKARDQSSARGFWTIPVTAANRLRDETSFAWSIAGVGWKRARRGGQSYNIHLYPPIRLDGCRET